MPVFRHILGTFSYENGELAAIQEQQDAMTLAALYREDPKTARAALSKLRSQAPALQKAIVPATVLAIKSALKRDVLLVQAISNIDETNRTINLFSKRLSEWVGYVLPEAAERASDAKLAAMVLEQRREDILRELRLFEEESMGLIPEELDYQAIRELAKQIRLLSEYRERQTDYLSQLMEEHCPNLKAVAGVAIGARLIALAGSLQRLAFSPASKIQLLGAEKALFRHLTTGARSPKHGIIHEHPLVLKSRTPGKAARVLADKLSIAAKVDYFHGAPVAGTLIKDLEAKFGPWASS